MRYLDLFAGAGGLSEGFIKAGFEPVAHVEISESACFTLKTRTAFHYLKQINNYTPYIEYTSGQISREKLYSYIPKEKLNSVICEEISAKTLKSIFENIDNLKGNEPIDLIVGGPPCQYYSIIHFSKEKSKKTKKLLLRFQRFVKYYCPGYILVENVPGIMTNKESVLNEFLQLKETELFTESACLDMLSLLSHLFRRLDDAEKLE